MELETHQRQPMHVILTDRVPQSHFVVQRMSLIVTDQFHQTLKLNGADGVKPSFHLDSAVFDFLLRPVKQQTQECYRNLDIYHYEL